MIWPNQSNSLKEKFLYATILVLPMYFCLFCTASGAIWIPTLSWFNLLTGRKLLTNFWGIPPGYFSTSWAV